MKKQTSALLGTLLMTVTAVAAHAQQQTPAASRFYIGAEYGSATLKDRSGDLAAALVAAVGGTATASQDTSVSVTRLLGGYNVSPNLGIELGYMQSGTVNYRFSGVSGSAYAGSANISISGMDYTVVLRPSSAPGLNGLFFKLGGHSLTQKLDVAVASGTAAVAGSSSTSGSGVLYGLGYDLKLSSNLDVRFAYTGADKIAGISNSNINYLSIGLIGRF
jgi:opacity protein-like surface antigen